jgi:hypothetical protein
MRWSDLSTVLLAVVGYHSCSIAAFQPQQRQQDQLKQVNSASIRWLRSRSSLGMGCDWYDIKTLCSSGTAIMVTNKDIKETRRSGSDKEDEEEYEEEYEEDDEDRLDAPLDKEDVEWLLDQTPEFNAYDISESFVLFTKGHNDIREAPGLYLPAAYVSDDEYKIFRVNIEKAPKGEEYTELFELACKFTPSGSKLSFAPGKYSFATTDSYMLLVTQLKRSDSSSDDTSKKINPADDNTYAPATVPFDFELIVGNGDKKKKIGVNRALFFCCFPHLETMFGDAFMDTKLELPELDPRAVQRVLETFFSRKKVSMPGRYTKAYKALQKVQCAFGKSMIEMSNEEPPLTRPRMEHPAIADPRWLDVSFLCGPQKEEIKVNRAVLASMNPVLHRVLFGTGLISVDLSKPIEWPDFDAQAVRQVFLALLHCGKKEFVVPFESVESAKMLVDYLMETREALMLYYDNPFKEEYEGGFSLARGEYGEGLKYTHRSD